MQVNLSLTIPDETAVSFESARLAAIESGTTLAKAIDNKATEVEVANSSLLVSGKHLLLEDEEVPITAINGSKATITRSAGVAHGAGTIVRVLRFSSISEQLKGLLADQLKAILNQFPSLTIKGKQDTIDAKKAEIEVFLKGIVS